jgi:hypothetical protein
MIESIDGIDGAFSTEELIALTNERLGKVVELGIKRGTGDAESHPGAAPRSTAR